MILVIGPTSSPAGQVVCVTVTGATGPLNASAWINDERVGVSVVEDPAGSWRVCVSIPKGTVGAVFIRMADKTTTVHQTVIVSR